MDKVILPYEYNDWNEIKNKLMFLKKNNSLKLLEETILYFLNQTQIFQRKWITSENPNFNHLRKIERLDNLKYIPLNLIPKLCDLAISIESIELKILKRNEKSSKKIILSRKQIGILLANQFFCICRPMENENIFGHLTGHVAPTGPLTFRDWLIYESDTTTEYLKTLILYFDDYFNNKINLFETVMFKKSVGNTDISMEYQKKFFTHINVHLKGKIEDVSSRVINAHVDFANANIGFGNSNTQEELLLGFSPETCVVVLFNEKLNHNEALLIQGAKIYNNASNMYKINWNKRQIIAIDAYFFLHNESIQSSTKFLKRELKKAIIGFKLAKETINTGHWGCGCYNGDKGLKALIQIIAAAISKKNLEYYTLEDVEFYSDFTKLINNLKIHKQTVYDLWILIKKYYRLNDPSIYRNSNSNILKWLNNYFEH